MKERAAVLIAIVALLAAAGMWVVGHFGLAHRIQQVELDLTQVSSQRDGRPPDEASVRELVERLAGEQDLTLVEGSLEVSVEPVTEANLDQVPRYAREAKKVADSLAAPQHGESKYETRMLLVKVRAELEGKKYFVKLRRPITRNLVVGGGG
ncbi:MAG TPA: hypothetical protein VKN99_20970 [Polyangia bacterium]|nr:hypothetical protein [Polyangia bacterium]